MKLEFSAAAVDDLSHRDILFPTDNVNAGVNTEVSLFCTLAAFRIRGAFRLYLSSSKVHLARLQHLIGIECGL